MYPVRKPTPVVCVEEFAVFSLVTYNTVALTSLLVRDKPPGHPHLWNDIQTFLVGISEKFQQCFANLCACVPRLWRVGKNSERCFLCQFETDRVAWYWLRSILKSYCVTLYKILQNTAQRLSMIGVSPNSVSKVLYYRHFFRPRPSGIFTPMTSHLISAVWLECLF